MVSVLNKTSAVLDKTANAVSNLPIRALKAREETECSSSTRQPPTSHTCCLQVAMQRTDTSVERRASTGIIPAGCLEIEMKLTGGNRKIK